MTRPFLRPGGAAAVTPAEFHILLALADADRHGYAIMQQVREESGGAVRLGPGTLYTAIGRLLEAGYVREVDTRPDPVLDDARRRYYRLTTAGRAVALSEVRRLDGLVALARAKKLAVAPTRSRGGR